MFSDQDPRRTLRDVGTARKNLAAWSRQFGRRSFGSVATMDVFSRLEGQLSGHHLLMTMAKSVRDNAANEDKRCSLPDCARLDPKFSRCARCGTVRACSASRGRR